MSSEVLKLLFVCSRNRRRSLTAERMFENVPGYDVRSAGTQPDARVALTSGLIRWADVIFFMERSHQNRASLRFQEELSEKRTTVLNIPDDFEYMDPALIDEVQAAVDLYFDASGADPI